MLRQSDDNLKYEWMMLSILRWCESLVYKFKNVTISQIALTLINNTTKTHMPVHAFVDYSTDLSLSKW